MPPGRRIARTTRAGPPRRPSRIPSPGRRSSASRCTTPGAIGLGSGTIIHSTPQQSIILTCAHIFKLQGGRQPKQASQFPRKITVDLFDGKLSGPDRAVRKVETVAAEALDYDFDLDVGLIRIRPGRRLPASRVVPASWQPEKRMPMITVGCSEGHDATTWETMISQPSVRGLVGNPNYEAIECKRAPKQGRSGGGLYTPDGYRRGGLRLRRAEGESRPLRLAPVHPPPARSQPPDRAVRAGHGPIRDAARPGTRQHEEGVDARPSPVPSRPTATSRPR